MALYPRICNHGQTDRQTDRHTDRQTDGDRGRRGKTGGGGGGGRSIYRAHDFLPKDKHFDTIIHYVRCFVILSY